MSNKEGRRNFLRLAGLAGLGAAITGCVVTPKETPTPINVKNTLNRTPTAVETKAPVVATPTKPIEARTTVTPIAIETKAPVVATPQLTETLSPVKNYWETTYATPAKKEGTVSILHDSDGKEVKIDLTKATGFTPDTNLKVSDINPTDLGIVPKEASDFQTYLNGIDKLAGYTDGTNDYNQYGDGKSGPQVPVYSWMVHTGLNVELPGIGRVEGGPGRAAMVLIVNRTERVYKFPTNSVRVESGFQGWGRIWDGEADKVKETEKRLVNHYRTRLGQGIPETGFIGQCDQAEKNCDSVTVVTVERMQWGNNPDGTPRDQFRLIRAETLPAIK